ncbi:MAG: glycerol kinase, partial [Anaerolineales bacterium]
LMQFQADMLQVPVVLPTVVETTALGAAYAAGLAVGFWDDLEDLRSQWQLEKTWQPQMAIDQRDALIEGWRKAVERTFNWVD